MNRNDWIAINRFQSAMSTRLPVPAPNHAEWILGILLNLSKFNRVR